MPEIALQDLKHAAQAVWQETHASLTESRQRLQDQQERLKTCERVISMLKGLPDRPSRDIMVPLGKAAFLPARLTDTERCHVTLGHGVQMECSVERAIGILEQQLQSLKEAMQTTEEEVQALERRMLIAESTLRAPLQGDSGMMDIHEEEDLALLSEEPSQSVADPIPSSSTAPDSTIQGDESRGEPLVLEEGKEGKTGRRRSVTFAEAPLVEGSGQGGQPKGPGLRKGFFGKPKPVLKRTSSIPDDSSTAVDRPPPEGKDPSVLADTRQVQSRRDTAFSGHVVERSVPSVTKPALTHSIQHAAASTSEGKAQTEVSSGTLHPKVSRFKQQRQKPV